MLRSDPVTPVDFRDAEKIALTKGNASFAKSVLTSRISLLVFPRNLGQGPSPDDLVEVITPFGRRQRRRAEVMADRYTIMSPQHAEGIWNAELAQDPGDEDTVFYVAAGTLLPLWDRLPRANAVVYQMMTDDGERILGRVMPEDWAEKFVARVSVSTTGGVDPDQALALLEAGEIATLSNAWVIEGRPSLLGQQTQIVLTLQDDHSQPYQAELEAMGLIAQPCPMRKGELVFTLPNDPKARAASFKQLCQTRSVVGVTNLSSAA
jgi:hypothetical protein